jgi:micrococcal nuclease
MRRSATSALLVACALQAVAAPAPASVGLVAVEAGPTLVLADGVRLRLAGIVVPPPLEAAARDRLALLAARGGLAVTQDGLDRHGRTVGSVTTDGAGDLALALLAAGLAIAAPPGGDVPVLLRAEAEARAAGRGLWARADLGQQDARGLRAEPARYAVVIGQVARVGTGGRWTYLNFGRDRRTDFTVRVASNALRTFRRAGIDPTKLERRVVRVRGWVMEQDGPMIEVSLPAQMEVVE